MTEESKLIKNGYLRTSHNIKSNNFCLGELDDGTSTVNIPLLSIETNSRSRSDSPALTETTNCDSVSATKILNACNPAMDSNEPHHTQRLPTVVYLNTDSGGGSENSGLVTGMLSGGGLGSTTSSAAVTDSLGSLMRTPLQRNTNVPSYNALIPRSNGAVSVRPRALFILAIAFTVLGMAIGALAIYFAGGNRHQPVATTNTDIGQQQNVNSYSDFNSLNDNICLTQECVKTASSLMSAMDVNANPCDNFFQYACGTWNKIHIIPEDRSSTSTFEVLFDQQQVILKSVLEEAINGRDNQATIKAKNFYKTCMNLTKIRKISEIHVKNVLKSLGGWPVIEDNWRPPNVSIERLMGNLRGNYSEAVLVELYVGADDKNSSINVLQIDQLLFVLPSRDYYLKDNSENYLNAYHRYMTQTAVLLGAEPERAAQELHDVLQFEIKLVNATLPEADRYDTSAIYKKISLPDLQKQVPEINWAEFLQVSLGDEIKFEEDEQLVSYAMPYLVEMGKILKTTDRRIVHNYVLWRLINSITAHMVDDYQRERVEFRKVLFGIQSDRSRWSQCVDWTNKKLGMAVGALFIRDNFNQDSKETALEMIHTIREAFNELLAENDWMDDETRAVAKEKADQINERIGYPEILTNAEELEKEYVNLTIVDDNFIQNMFNVLKWDSEKNLQLLHLPVDKEKWTTQPADVNAFYNPNKNDILFPAGIFQPLFYSQNFPKSLNYGGIGVVIGHEITHGFDDKGRQFDKFGDMMQWWNNATIDAFRNRTQCIIDQYSRYKIEEVGMYMDGRMTQGENIADNGGLKQAFRAYKKWVRHHGSEPLLPGLNLTHDQLFFLNYAQIWCGSMRPEDALIKIRSSVHPPGFIRVLGPLSNSKDFSQAYKCKLGSPMNPVEKCNVW